MVGGEVGLKQYAGVHCSKVCCDSITHRYNYKVSMYIFAIIDS